MLRFVLIMLLSFVWAFGVDNSYISELYSHIISRSWHINGKFYKYDFEKDGAYGFNDWLYISDHNRPYRLLGEEPTENDKFGWKELDTIPNDLPEVSGYFVYIGFSRDDSRFSWLYITKKMNIYKLMGADPVTHFFQYLDLDGDTRADKLPYLTPVILDSTVNFIYECEEVLPGMPSCPISSSSASSSSSSESSSASSSSQGCNDPCNYQCLIGSGAASSIPSTIRYAKLDKRLQINDADVKIYEITNTGSFRLVKSTKTYRAPEGLFFDFNFCEGSECQIYHDSRYYLVQITGGCNFDVDMDGEREDQGRENKATVRAIVKGEWIKNGAAPIVSLASEIAYEKLAAYIKYHFHPLGFGQEMQKVAKDMFISDINGDGVIDFKDTLFYEDDTHSNALTFEYRSNLHNMYTALKDGKYPSFFMDSIYKYFSFTAYDMAIDNDRLYTCNYDKLVVVDIAHPGNERVLKQINLPDRGYSLLKSGNKVYIGSIGKIFVVNLQNDQVMTLAGTSGKYEDLAFDTDGKIYALSHYGNSLEKIDPQSGSITQSINTLTGANEIAIKTFNGIEYAFIANGATGLTILRLTPTQNYTTQPRVRWDIPLGDRAEGLFIRGNYIFVAAGKAGLKVVDFASKSVVGSLPPFFYSTDIWVEGNIAYLADQAGGVRIVDISNMSQMHYLGFIDTWQYPNELCVITKDNRKIAIVVDRNLRLSFMDVTNPYYMDFQVAALINTVVSQGCSNIYTLARRGNILYSAGDDEICSFIINQRPTSLTLLDSVSLNDSSIHFKDLIVAHSRDEAYALDWKKGMVKINTTNPANLTTFFMTNRVGAPYENANNMVFSQDESHIFISDNRKIHDIRVYSIPPSIDQVYLTQVPVTNYISGMALSQDGNRLLVSCTGKLLSYDVTDVENPVYEGWIQKAGFSSGIASFHHSNKAMAFWYYGESTLLDLSRGFLGARNLHAMQNGKGFATAGAINEDDTYFVTHTISGDINIYKLGTNSYEYEGFTKTFGYWGKNIAFHENGDIVYVPQGVYGIGIIDLEVFDPIRD